MHASTSTKVVANATSNKTSQPLFGIVAASSKDNVIGINGKLPWKDNLPQDREHFVNLTRNKILIVGRKTFFDEDPTGGHVKHVRTCIVVSKTMDATDLLDSENESDGSGKRSNPDVKLARSFGEALDIAAHQISSNKTTSNDQCDVTIQCWVAGGERIYEEALQHTNATEVHLTRVDMIVGDDTTDQNEVAYFPIAELERCDLQEVSRVKNGICTFYVYKRLPPTAREDDETPK